MKNQKTLLGIAVAILLLLTSFSLKSQTCCPFTITNSLDCDIEICYDFVDPSCIGQCAACNITLTANGGSFTVPCCVAGMDCYVTVTSPFVSNTVNGLSSPGCNSGLLNPTDSGPAPAGCSSSTNYQINWTCSGVTITP